MLVYLLSLLDDAAGRARFKELFAAQHDRMLRVALGILRDQADAEDAVQNAFVQIIRHFEKIFQIPCDELGFWCISIVKNEAIQILRKKKKNVVPLEDWDAFEEGCAGVHDYSALVACFARLPETYRAALEMKLLLGYSNKEIAEQLGLTEEAVKKRISRGRKLLQEIVLKEGFEP